MNKDYRKLSELKNWDKNPRSIKGQFLKGSIPHNKGMGMSIAEKKEARNKTLVKYNSNPINKARVKKWHLAHGDRVREIKTKYANTERGLLIRKENSHRRIARVKNLKYKINWKYFKWLCEKVGYKCLGCGKQCDIRTITIDHQLPINCGGDNQEWNLMPLCKSCNSRKQDRLMFMDNVIVDVAYGLWLQQ